MSRFDAFIVLVIFACAAGLLLILTPISLAFRLAGRRAS